MQRCRQKWGRRVKGGEKRRTRLDGVGTNHLAVKSLRQFNGQLRLSHTSAPKDGYHGRRRPGFGPMSGVAHNAGGNGRSEPPGPPVVAHASWTAARGIPRPQSTAEKHIHRAATCRPEGSAHMRDDSGGASHALAGESIGGSLWRGYNWMGWPRSRESCIARD